MSKKDGFFDNYIDRNLYITAGQQAQDKNLPKQQRYIGYAIYMWHKFESRAFENGTYSYIMSKELNFFGDELRVAKELAYYKRIMWIAEAAEFVKSDISKSTEIAKTIYGKTYNWLLKTAEYSLKECRRQFGRAVVKAREDYDWTHGGKTSITV